MQLHKLRHRYIQLKMNFLILILITLIFLPVIGAQSASFDCNRAQQAEIEKAICGHPKLNRLDEQLGAVYHDLKKRLAPEKVIDLLREQRQWLEYRDDNCLPTQIDCLLKVYRDRIEMLKFKMSPEFETAITTSISGRYVIENYMFMSVVPISKERVLIEIGGAEPITVRWVCSFSGVGILQDRQLTIVHESENTPITFTFSKGGVEVEGENLGYFCGLGGQIGGFYKKEVARQIVAD